MKRTVFLAAGFLSLLISLRLSAQKSVSYFAQSPQNGPHCRVFCAQKSQQYVYLGGTSFDSLGFYYTPTVVKLDTAGNTIWTCTVTNQTGTGDIYWAGYVKNMAMDDSSLYVHVASNGSALHEIWRVSLATGDIVWKKTVTDAVVLNVSSSSTISYTYNVAINYYTNNYVYEMADKATGKTVYTTTIAPTSEGAGDCFLSYDKDGTTYIIKGDSVIKYADPKLSTVTWNKKMGSPGGLTAVSMQDDALYFAGSGLTFFAGKLNKADGSIAWMTYSSISSYTLSDMVSDLKVVNNGVYVLGEDMDPGNGYSAYHVAKFDRTSGHVTWESDYNPQWATVGAANAGETSGKSVDIDALGNAYVTGYEGGNNSRTGKWV